MTSKQNYKYLKKINTVTPYLREKVIEFIAHIEVSEAAPILITGPSGAGKSLFINILEQKNKKDNSKDNNIHIENCANIDPNLAESELFGHIKGAFTGAIADKEGLLKSLDKKTLVLDEIGELPLNVQAKLLTFIENGHFRPIGGNKTKTSDVRIVGVTSRRDNLREDLLNRFFEFSISPLYKRRGDVLYYFAKFEPDLIEDLTPMEVLILLANNWKGNVRDINNMLLYMKRSKKIGELIRKWEGKSIEKSENKPEKKFSLRYYILHSLPTIDNLGIFSKEQEHFFRGLYQSSVKIDFLEKYLNRLNVGIDINNNERVFKNYKKESTDTDLDEPDSIYLKKIEKEYHLEFMLKYQPFEDAIIGFQRFCWMFFQAPDINKNALDTNEGETIECPFDNFFNYPLDILWTIDLAKDSWTIIFEDALWVNSNKNDPNLTEARRQVADELFDEDDPTWNPDLRKLLNDIFKHLTGITPPEHIRFPMTNYDQRVKMIADLLEMYPDNPFLNSIADKIKLPQKAATEQIKLPQKVATEQKSIWQMGFKELQAYYFTELINSCDGNKTKAAEKAEMHYSTFYSRVNNLEKKGYIK